MHELAVGTGWTGLAREGVGRAPHEVALATSEARMRAMLDSALDAVVTIDHEGRVVEFNVSAERMFGYARRDVIGKQMVELLVPPRLRAAHTARVPALPRDGRGACAWDGGSRCRRCAPTGASSRSS